MESIIREVAAQLERPLSVSEQKYIAQLYVSLDKRQFSKYDQTKITQVLGKVFADKLASLVFTATKREFDLHEYQKTELGDVGIDPEAKVQDDVLLKTESGLEITSFLGIDNLADLKLMFNPDSLLTHYYMALDSDFRDVSQEIGSAITRFTWAYTPTLNIGPGFCNSVGVIRNVVGMRMYQPRVPYLAAMNNTAKRVSILIEEFQAQSFIAETGFRFHFCLRPQFVGGQTSIELSTEDYNDGIFTFRKPFTKIDSMTLRFGDPVNVLTFSTPFDRFIIVLEFVCLNLDN